MLPKVGGFSLKKNVSYIPPHLVIFFIMFPLFMKDQYFDQL